MRKRKLLLVTAVLSGILTFPAYAGTWTHTYETQSKSSVYDNLWFYIKEDGSYANQEWIQDSDGTWFWINEEGYVPLYAGVADDGRLYNCQGIYIDMNDNRRFASQDLYSQIKEGMDYSQVAAVLGKEHEVVDSYQSSFADHTYDYLYLRWYSEDTGSSIMIGFTNGQVSIKWADWK